MLNENPELRLTLPEIIEQLDQKLAHLSNLEAANTQSTIRIPSLVDPSLLKKLENGNLSVFSKEEISQIDHELKKGKRNSHIKISGKSVFLTKTGDAFVLYAPISHGATASTFLVQNIQNQSWSVMKVVKGQEYKIRGKIIQLENENKILNDLNYLNGTLEMKIGNESMSANIQPYAYGESYEKMIKTEGQIPIEKANLMILKSLEAISTLHQDHRCLHRDLKPENMIWDPIEQKCQLIDFGCAAISSDQPLEIQDPIFYGTPEYQAPEIDASKMIKNDRIYSEKTDSYSIGIVIREILSQVDKNTNSELYEQLTELQSGLTKTDPQKRLTTKETFLSIQKISQKSPPTENINTPRAITHDMNRKHQQESSLEKNLSSKKKSKNTM